MKKQYLLLFISVLVLFTANSAFAGRYYDCELGRWLSIDPKADKYPGWSPYNYCADNPLKYIDPNGNDWILSTGNQVNWYGGKTGDKSNLISSYKATSGNNEAKFTNGKTLNAQFAKYQNLIGNGPTPEGKYSINLAPDPNRLAKIDLNSGTLLPNPKGGIEKIPGATPNPNHQGYEFLPQNVWGENRAKLDPAKGNDLDGRENSFYIHDSDKGYTHGCIEVEPAFFNQLLEYQDDGNKNIDVIIQYQSPDQSTNGGTKK
jgi:hypothetical protein